MYREAEGTAPVRGPKVLVGLNVQFCTPSSLDGLCFAWPDRTLCRCLAASLDQPRRIFDDFAAVVRVHVRFSRRTRVRWQKSPRSRADLKAEALKSDSEEM